MKYLIVGSCIGLASCATVVQKEQNVETLECMQYRSMMTAPMQPNEHEKMKASCENSQKISH